MPTPAEILIVTAVDGEKEAVLNGLEKDSRFNVIVGGVGAVAVAVNTSRALTADNYRLVISAGIGGGFSGKAAVGSLVVATECVAADLGAETPTGFCNLDDLGFGVTSIKTDSGIVEHMMKALQKTELTVYSGPVLTVSTITGTSGTAKALSDRTKGASAEAMEGFGVGFAALSHGVPFFEIRAISNVVGPRDRTSWKVKEALDNLGVACKVLREVLV
ncbi:hypothetical protein DP73_15100 [Desulfosporosinus sp. HMP52]|uniref:futalosine hydrolase n=1 Tax=Desulfosporosinus sp. HMP52 TaxID=1487923 RepID=UPI00051F8936|nr:futalosine hydrolase [Desulfosporosinus sp. HMP52]KGK87145.1 hypothetical protein DP73_15100 [Desulfosporosinus sp. HMP52]